MKANAETANVALGSDSLNSISRTQENQTKQKARERLEDLRRQNGPVFYHCRNSGNTAKGFHPL